MKINYKTSRKNFEKLLKSRCPNTFKLLNEPGNGSPREPIQYGTEIASGWYDAMFSCALKLECLKTDLIVVQLKEKFGTVCIYTEGGNEATRKVILEAEQEINKICENCGAFTGVLRTSRSWWRTLCDVCAKWPVKND